MSARRHLRGGRAAALLVAMGLAAPNARAELVDDAERLLSAWRASGAVAERATTLFLSQGEKRRVELPAAATRDRCLHVVALAERAIGFTATAVLPGDESAGGLAGDEHARASQSVLGVVEVETRCGATRSRVVELVMGSSRGAVEILIATSGEPTDSAELALPERIQGPIAGRSAIGRAPAPAPFAERLARATRVARLDGASLVATIAVPAGSDGTGAVRLDLSPGCHRLGLLAGDLAPGDDALPDIDAEARAVAGSDRDERGAAVLAVDRSHAPDGRLELCLGRKSRVDVRFAGAAGAASVAVLDALWALPQGFPQAWSPPLKAAIAGALWRARMPPLPGGPIEELLGGAGTTSVALQLEPGRCYLAALGLEQGHVEAARVAVHVGDRVHYDDVDEDRRGAALAFCTGAERRAELGVRLRSAAANWRFALFSLGRDAQ